MLVDLKLRVKCLASIYSAESAFLTSFLLKLRVKGFNRSLQVILTIKLIFLKCCDILERVRFISALKSVCVVSCILSAFLF